MKSIKLLIFAGIVPGILLCMGCDSDRDNKYDPLADNYGYYFEWETRAGMSIGRYNIASAVLDKKIYVIGGYNNINDELTDVEIYSPASNTWSSGSAMPTERQGLSAVTLNNYIYTIGGFDSPNRLNTVERFNGSDWNDVVDPLGAARAFHGSAVLNNKIYVIGGYGSTLFSTVTDYDSESWGNGSGYGSMSTARMQMTVTACNNKIYVIGGTEDGSTPISTVEEFDPSNSGTEAWTTKAPMPTARYWHCAVCSNNRIYVFGGYGDSDALDTVEVFDPVTNTWESLEHLSTARYGATAAVVDDILYIIGGRDSAGEFLKSVEALVPHYM